MACNENKSTILNIILMIIVFTLVGIVSADEPQIEALPETNRMRPDHLPTPFSAEEIRRGCPAGRMIKFLIETPDKPISYQVFDFKEGTEESAHFEAYTLDENGNVIGPKNNATLKWTDLQAHASYAKKNTTVNREFKTIASGTFDCWQYTMTTEDHGKTKESRYWFAIALPGPPILVRETIDGKEIFKMTQCR